MHIKGTYHFMQDSQNLKIYIQGTALFLVLHCYSPIPNNDIVAKNIIGWKVMKKYIKVQCGIKVYPGQFNKLAIKVQGG